MKQHQAPKEKPRTNDKFKTLGVRMPEWLHKECLKSGRGSSWVRKVLESALK